MCGGSSDPFPAVSETIGMSIVDVAGFLALTAAPLGFLVSCIAGIRLLRGKARLLCIFTLALGSVSIGLFLASELRLGDYAIRRHFQNLGIFTVFCGLFLVYLRHTYWPTTERWINLPATLGFALNLAALLVLLLFT